MAQPFSQGREEHILRAGQVRLGVGIELAAIDWMAIAAGVTLSVGLAMRSVSLQC